MKYLFLCSAGEHRSPLAAEVAREILEREGRKAEIDSGGISGLNRKALEDRIRGYDVVLVMEKWMQNRVRSATHNQVIPKNLNLSDNYVSEQDKERLRRELRRRLPRYL